MNRWMHMMALVLALGLMAVPALAEGSGEPEYITTDRLELEDFSLFFPGWAVVELHQKAHGEALFYAYAPGWECIYDAQGKPYDSFNYLECYWGDVSPTWELTDEWVRDYMESDMAFVLDQNAPEVVDVTPVDACVEELGGKPAAIYSYVIRYDYAPLGIDQRRDGAVIGAIVFDDAFGVYQFYVIADDSESVNFLTDALESISWTGQAPDIAPLDRFLIFGDASGLFPERGN